MFAVVNGKSIHFTKTGQGDTVMLLVHGWGGTGRSLQGLARLLSRRNLVLTIDLPGFGSSDRPESTWGIKEYASLLAGFINQQTQKPVVYFGHSFGGALGIYLAANQPGIVSKLIVAGASFHRPSLPKKNPSSFASRLPLPGLSKLLLRRTFYKLFYPHSDILNYPQLECNYRRIVAEDLTHLLSHIRQPTLILWGDRDRDTPVEDARLLAEKIAGSKLVIFSDVSHNLPLKHADRVYSEMEQFL